MRSRGGGCERLTRRPERRRAPPRRRLHGRVASLGGQAPERVSRPGRPRRRRPRGVRAGQGAPLGAASPRPAGKGAVDSVRADRCPGNSVSPRPRRLSRVRLCARSFLSYCCAAARKRLLGPAAETPAPLPPQPCGERRQARGGPSLCGCRVLCSQLCAPPSSLSRKEAERTGPELREAYRVALTRTGWLGIACRPRLLLLADFFGAPRYRALACEPGRPGDPSISLKWELLSLPAWP